MNDRYDLGVTYTCRRNLSKYSWHAAVTYTCTWPIMSLSASLASVLHAILNSSMNLPDTAVSASSGHGRNQSMVQPLMRPGNCCARRLNLLPTGEKHSTMCRLSRTRLRKKPYRFSHVSGTPGACDFMMGRMSFTIMSSSSLGSRPATSPVMRIWLMYSRKPSSLTSASVKMKHTGWPLKPAILYSALMSSNRLVVLYVLVTVIWNVYAPAMYAASRDSDCLPEPPTPTSSAWPLGLDTMREMRHTCFMASSNSTRSITALVSLYSFSASISVLYRLA
mmetsp:Transcript_13360/g.32664  ORF Transcript_13360/g.32664 Transcript_13360/m.32664 type:complete len:278 (-) Transcript_13360:588-1421(-)